MRETTRKQLIRLVRTAINVGNFRFAQEAALAWLSVFPGDLAVSLYHAETLVNMRRFSQVKPVLKKINQRDPLYLEAWEMLGNLHKILGEEVPPEVRGALLALSNKPDPRSPGPDWGLMLWLARRALEKSQLPEAEGLIQKALSSAPDVPLVGLTHLQILQARHALHPRLHIRKSIAADRLEVNPNLQAMYSLADFYHKRWPECLYFSLILANTLMDGGEPEVGVALIHKAAANDVTGQVAIRLWGVRHPFKDLWPKNLRFFMDLPVPAGVAVALGWNRLPSRTSQPGSNGNQLPSPEPIPPSPPNETPEVPTGEEAVLPKAHSHPPTQVAPGPVLKAMAERTKVPEILQSNGRFPVYIVFSTRTGLQKKYGSEAASRIIDWMHKVSHTVDAYRGWGARVVLGDDPKSTAAMGVKPAKASDPWGLKLVLSDLDLALQKQGEMIGSLLIVGGPEVVPFHRLPNPIDDADTEVPSDNPYGTRDENYFITEWPVGRLADGAGSSPDHLLSLLKRVCAHHKKIQRPDAWPRRFWNHFLTLVGIRFKIDPSLGYTAEIWKNASRKVYQPIGEPDDILVSPPLAAVTEEVEEDSVFSSPRPSASSHKPNGNLRLLQPASLGYFNLHGMEDSTEWYGQRDPFSEEAGPDYPVALRPVDILNGGRAPEVVFTEACYGGHITNRKVDEAIALKFLEAGTHAIIGSTVTAYGSIKTPLIAADMLGHTFWRYLRKGKPAGEALRLAKVYLAKEMHKRQGYLDGEDQKTLISFVLYGDPLAMPLECKPHSQPKTILRPVRPPENVHIVCDRTHKNGEHCQTVGLDQVSLETLVEVKRVVNKYLPGMNDARVLVSKQHTKKCGTPCKRCPLSQPGAKSHGLFEPKRKVVTLVKEVKSPPHTHAHYARMTLGEDGKVIKLVVSR